MYRRMCVSGCLYTSDVGFSWLLYIDRKQSDLFSLIFSHFSQVPVSRTTFLRPIRLSLCDALNTFGAKRK